MQAIWPRFRKFFFWVHLTVGLTAAIPVFVMCVTGFLLAYQIQIEAWIDHWGVKSSAPHPGAQPLTIASLIEAARKIRDKDPQSITIFRDPVRPVEIDVDRTPGPEYLDAYSGSVIGGPSPKVRQLFRTVTWWHIALGVPGKRGSRFRSLVSGANLLALVSAILGLLIWLPRRWSWRQLRATALLRWGVAGYARDFNWHNALGIWSVIPLLVILWTGTAMSYGRARLLTEKILSSSVTRSRAANGMTPQDGPAGHEAAGLRAALSLDALLQRAKQQSPGWKAITVFLPRQESDPVHFAIDMSGYGGFGKVSGLALDRTGKAVYFTPAGNASLTSSTFIRFGHTGEAWGVAGQTVAGLSSLSGVMLVWTGVALSLRRLKSWRARRARSVARSA
jgi:uncharacterized iron-regulated membrane protein